MKRNLNLIMAVVATATLLFSSCMDDNSTSYKSKEQKTSTIPSSTAGRKNDKLGTIYVKSKNLKIYAWDHGKIDGDIVSIYANNSKAINRRTLKGPSSKIGFKWTLGHTGYNHMILYAHNEGSISPNTCAISINDGYKTQQFTLRANLKTNGAYNIVLK